MNTEACTRDGEQVSVVSLEGSGDDVAERPERRDLGDADRQNDREKNSEKNSGRAGEGSAITVPSVTPITCNTGVTISQSTSRTKEEPHTKTVDGLCSPPGALEKGGVDTLEASLYGFWHPATWPDTRSKCEKALAAAQAGITQAAYITTNEGDVLTVNERGQKHGVYCRYCLQWNGVDIAIVDNPAPSEHRLSVFAKIGSVRLMEVGHGDAWLTLLEVLSSLGFAYERSVPSRFDPCVDLPDVGMDIIEAAIAADWFTCKATRDKMIRKCRKWETYAIGSQVVMMRIYAKARECRNDERKRALLIERRWGHDCEHALRIEFQLRSKALRCYFNIRTVEELFGELGTVTEWCTSTYFRMVKPFDRENLHYSRSEVSPLWKQVQESFAEWAGPSGERRKPRRRRPDLKALRQQIVGCTTSAVAHLCDVEGNPEAALAAYRREGQRILREGEAEAVKQIGRKQRELVAAARGPEIDESQIPF